MLYEDNKLPRLLRVMLVTKVINRKKGAYINIGVTKKFNLGNNIYLYINIMFVFFYDHTLILPNCGSLVTLLVIRKPLTRWCLHLLFCNFWSNKKVYCIYSDYCYEKLINIYKKNNNSQMVFLEFICLIFFKRHLDWNMFYPIITRWFSGWNFSKK
jgi:hypothetical protein